MNLSVEALTICSGVKVEIKHCSDCCKCKLPNDSVELGSLQNLAMPVQPKLVPVE